MTECSICNHAVAAVNTLGECERCEQERTERVAEPKHEHREFTKGCNRCRALSGTDLSVGKPAAEPSRP